MKSIVQTMGKAIAGGDKGGFTKALKSSIEFLVNSADNPPAKSGMATAVIKDFHLIFTFITSLKNIYKFVKNYSLKQRKSRKTNAFGILSFYSFFKSIKILLNMKINSDKNRKVAATIKNGR